MYYVQPQAAMAAPIQPQMQPMGWVGDQVSHYAPVVGGIVGGAAGLASGNPLVGGIAGGAATVLARDYGGWLPFEAGPGGVPAAPAAYAPQGFFGGLGGRVVGGIVGNAFGNRGAGQAIGGALGSLLPFQAGPPTAAPAAYAPQGWWGNAIRDVGGAVGGVVGGRAGDIITDVTGLGQYLPFQAGPQMAAPAAYAPQGWWGNAIRDVGGAIGGVVGGRTGDIITDVTGLGQYLPFQAGPQMAAPAAYAPQGLIGGFLGSVAGGAIGNAFGHRGAGRAIGGALGALLPFQAGPGAPVQYMQVPNEQVVYH